jgi:uncharacterized coiled-coil protein SlyX
MGVSEKVMEALRAGILLNERVSTLIEKVDRMDQDMRRMNDRLIRVETMLEMARVQPVRTQPPEIEK